MTRPDGPRILAYSHDSIGLGHMRRNANIVNKLMDRAPGASALMLIGSPAGFVFALPEGMDYLKLPSIAKYGRTDWRSARLRVSDDRVLKMRAGIIREAAVHYAPDILLVDHMPLGITRELRETLQALSDLPDRPRIVLGLRDILDAPDRVRELWAADGIDEAIARFYDDVLIYGQAALFDSVAAYGIDQMAPGRARYCGYVAADMSGADGSAVRARLGVEGRPFVVVSGGGGRDAFGLLDTVLQAVEAMAPTSRPAMFLVGGPLMPPDDRAALSARAAALGCPFAEHVPNFPDHLAAADAFIGMGGYNSITEALHLGVPTVLVPRSGPTEEQRLRAKMLSAKGALEMIDPAEASVERFESILAAVQFGTPRRAAVIATDGADRAADRLAEVLQARGQRINPR